jgi:hypothetical protein
MQLFACRPVDPQTNILLQRADDHTQGRWAPKEKLLVSLRTLEDALAAPTLAPAPTESHDAEGGLVASARTACLDITRVRTLGAFLLPYARAPTTSPLPLFVS